jgi:hypothetical protein
MALLIACEPFLEREDITCDCDAFDDEVVELMIDQASDAIAILTGGKVSGVCTDIVRPLKSTPYPCNVDRHGYYNQWEIHDRFLSGGITLMGPNPSIVEVKIDGQVLPQSEYKIVDGVHLYRVEGRWPTKQNVLADDTEPNTFSISYQFGILPYIAKLAAEEIVCDMVRRDVRTNQTKSLPPSARSATIAGVSIQLEQQVEELRRRAILLPNLIRLLTIYAPDGGSPTTVYSPELEDGWILHRV